MSVRNARRCFLPSATHTRGATLRRPKMVFVVREIAAAHRVRHRQFPPPEVEGLLAARMVSNMVILRAELNYSRNVKRRNARKILQKNTQENLPEPCVETGVATLSHDAGSETSDGARPSERISRPGGSLPLLSLGFCHVGGICLLFPAEPCKRLPFEQSICLVERAEPAPLPKTSLKSDLRSREGRAGISRIRASWRNSNVYRNS